MLYSKTFLAVALSLFGTTQAVSVQGANQALLHSEESCADEWGACPEFFTKEENLCHVGWFRGSCRKTCSVCGAARARAAAQELISSTCTDDSKYADFCAEAVEADREMCLSAEFRAMCAGSCGCGKAAATALLKSEEVKSPDPELTCADQAPEWCSHISQAEPLMCDGSAMMTWVCRKSCGACATKNAATLAEANCKNAWGEFCGEAVKKEADLCLAAAFKEGCAKACGQC